MLRGDSRRYVKIVNRGKDLLVRWTRIRPVLHTWRTSDKSRIFGSGGVLGRNPWTDIDFYFGDIAPDMH